MKLVEKYLRKRCVAAVVLLTAFSFFINFQVLFNWFSIDDFILIIHNDFVKDINNLWVVLNPANIVNVLPVRLGARPVFLAALITQFHFFGYNPFGYHFVSVVIHIINSLMVFVIARGLGIGSRRALLPAVIAALIF
ncbi:MAG: hypothetical protein FWC85_03435, partial [Elusimicrobia bacterium]|nr:hypothetical protein [Elusimicrobiota bacterium]